MYLCRRRPSSASKVKKMIISLLLLANKANKIENPNIIVIRKLSPAS